MQKRRVPCINPKPVFEQSCNMVRSVPMQGPPRTAGEGRIISNSFARQCNSFCIEGSIHPAMAPVLLPSIPTLQRLSEALERKVEHDLPADITIHCPGLGAGLNLGDYDIVIAKRRPFGIRPHGSAQGRRDPRRRNQEHQGCLCPYPNWPSHEGHVQGHAFQEHVEDTPPGTTISFRGYLKA